MKRSKRLLAVQQVSKTAVLPSCITVLLLGCITVLMLCCGTVLAAPQAKYSVDATEIEYDLTSGDGTTTGKTTIQYDGGIAVAEGGATFNSKERTGHLYGGVIADKEDNHLKSDELFMYSQSFISAVGSAVLTKGDKTLQAPRVDYHDDKKFAETLGGFARISSTDGSWLTAGKIVYDMKTGLANATGGVNMENTARKMTGSADRAVYDSHETGYIELIGNARATQDGNTVSGNKIRVTNVSGPNSKTHAQGNVRLVYYPQEKKEAETDGETLAQKTKSKKAARTRNNETVLAQSTKAKAAAAAPKAGAATTAQNTKSTTEDKTV